MSRAVPLNADEPALQAAWNKIERRSWEECWLWHGPLDADGYGKFSAVIDGRRRHLRAHRVAYLLATGELSPDLDIDHLCRNHRCCNPRHMEPVTVGTNVMRGNGICPTLARRTHCSQGHELTGDNLLMRMSRGKPCRLCRQCRNAWGRAATERRKIREED